MNSLKLLSLAAVSLSLLAPIANAEAPLIEESFAFGLRCHESSTQSFSHFVTVVSYPDGRETAEVCHLRDDGAHELCYVLTKGEYRITFRGSGQFSEQFADFKNGLDLPRCRIETLVRANPSLSGSN